MAGSHFSSAYGALWEDVLVGSTTGDSESDHYRKQLLHPFFRLDVILDLDLDASVDAAHDSLPSETYEDFDAFIASRLGHQIVKDLPLTDDGKDIEYSE